MKFLELQKLQITYMGTGLPAPTAQIRHAVTLSWRSRSRRSLTQAASEEIYQPTKTSQIWLASVVKTSKKYVFSKSFEHSNANHPTIQPSIRPMSSNVIPFKSFKNHIWSLNHWKLKISKLFRFVPAFGDWRFVPKVAFSCHFPTVFSKSPRISE